MNNFENSLLSELHTVVAQREPQRPLTSRLRKPGFVALPAGVLGVAAAAVVGFGALGGASAAYAVTTGSNGDVVVTINALSDASGLQSQLRAHGINAYVDYSPHVDGTISTGPGAQHPLLRESVTGTGIPANAQKSVSGSLGKPIPGTSLLPANVQLSPNSTTIDIPAADVNSSYKLYITTSGSTHSLAQLQLTWLK